MTTTRKYNGKDIDMLVSCSTLLENALANKTFLQSKRSTWTDDFFTAIQTKIDKALVDFLGVDSAKSLRGATQTLQNIQKQALKDLAEVKVQIVEDFKKEPIKQSEMLTQLGFTAYQKGSQEALVQLLYQFKTNLSSSLKSDLVTKGIEPSILDQITSYADTLKNADVTQETFKGTRKEITEAGVSAFNEIYDDVISIAKIAANFYKEEPIKKDLFSYRKIHATLSAQKLAPKTATVVKS